jgi:hypothetical protein
MDTGKLKTFASEARKVLLSGISQRITQLGFNLQGVVTERPQPVGGGYLFGGHTFNDVDFFPLWQRLADVIGHHGLKNVIEEAAYTWFNRLVAIRILQKNQLIQPVLAYDAATGLPMIVAEARRGIHPAMSADDEQRLARLLMDDKKETEQFALLIKAFCQTTPALDRIFGAVDDYTMLLLPTRILDKGNFVDLLNNSEEWIAEEDYRSTELIGWLYQFYISDKKDEVFASFKNKHKAEAEDIPAATQIFTPNWIVKYMVQNTIGRIYLDNHRRSELKEEMKYLVEPAEQTEDNRLKIALEDMTMIDPACGSGHILDESFDTFLAMYNEQGYSSHEATRLILTHNIIGIDIDTRAKQLATFSLLLKAAQQDAELMDCSVMPRILNMPAFDESRLPGGSLEEYLPHFFLGGSRQDIAQTSAALSLMRSANNLGSIMKFDIAPTTREDIERAVTRIEENQEAAHFFILPFMQVILALTEKYAAVVANPPYMGGGNMNAELSQYVKDNYPDSKADLFSVFMEVANGLLEPCGKYGMINMQSWMFLSSFEKLRKNVLEESHIDSMLHLGPRTFDELSGEVVQNTAFVISNNHWEDSKGTYFRLVDGKNCSEKEQMFLNDKEQGAKIYYPAIPQSNFETISGNPIAYWISEKIKIILSGSLSSNVLKARHGLLTGNDEKYLRCWFEVPIASIGLNFHRYEDFLSSNKSYCPMNKGGERRRWYGNNQIIVKLRGCIQYFNNNKLNEKELFFKEGITWTEITKDACIRYSKPGILFGHKGATAYFYDNNDLFVYLGYSNSKVYQEIKNILFTGLSFTAGNFEKMPYIKGNNYCKEIVNNNISIAKEDWDIHETSWDFKENELIRMQHNCSGNVSDLDMLDEDERAEVLATTDVPTDASLMENCVKAYKSKWERKFMQLHHNEEELNRQFIEIYGLEDELTPDVPLSEITILQQGEISIEQEDTED